MYVKNLSAITKWIKYDLQLLVQQRKHERDAKLSINMRQEKEKRSKEKDCKQKPKIKQ